MKKLHQRAIELADMIETTPYAKSVLAGQISQAIDEARDAALEEAAQAMDSFSHPGFAKTIRALKGK